MSSRGSHVAFGAWTKSYGPGWITARQIASRIVISRVVRKIGKMIQEFS